MYTTHYTHDTNIYMYVCIYVCVLYVALSKYVNIISDNYDEEVMEQVEIFIKYSGYINKVEKEAAKMLKQEEKQIPKDINYSEIPNLASEARQKLERVNPETIGQALRISGVNPADISILLIYLRKKYHE